MPSTKAIATAMRNGRPASWVMNNVATSTQTVIALATISAMAVLTSRILLSTIPELDDFALMLLAHAAGMKPFEDARSVDHARQPSCQHVQQRADPGEQEGRRDRGLDRLRDR